MGTFESKLAMFFDDDAFCSKTSFSLGEYTVDLYFGVYSGPNTTSKEKVCFPPTSSVTEIEES